MSTYLPIAITGHIDLLEEDQSVIEGKIKELYRTLRERHQKNLRLYSALAPGADTWAAQCLIDGNVEDELVYVQALPDESYLDYTFGGIATKYAPKRNDYRSNEAFRVAEEAYQKAKLKYSKNKEIFEGLRKAALTDSSILKDQDLDYSNDAIRIESYFRLGAYLVEKADVLITLWDGVDGGGVGGTSDVVKMWVKGRSQNGEKVNHRKTERTLYHLPVRRSKNLFPIRRNFTSI